MASLSKEMRNKRDIKRMPSLLIIDKDLGNIGLYKSILSAEYEMDNVFDLGEACLRLDQKEYDAIVLDDDFLDEEILSFLDKVKTKTGEPAICLITDRGYDAFIIKALCKGVARLVNKPFTRDGLSNAVYDELKARRENYIKKHIVIVDDNLDNLKNMKAQLEGTYNVTIINCCEMGLRYIQKYHPDLVIADASMAKMSGIKMCDELEMNKENNGVALLFMTDDPSEECVLKCAQFKPEGFLVKPFPMEQLLSHIERIFLIETYSRRKN